VAAVKLKVFKKLNLSHIEQENRYKGSWCAMLLYKDERKKYDDAKAQSSCDA
jgi:hypothetical protein